MLEPSSGQDVDETLASRLEHAGARRLHQGKKKNGSGGFHYRKVFRRYGVAKCSVLNRVKLTAGSVLKRKVVSDKVTQIDMEL